MEDQSGCDAIEECNCETQLKNEENRQVLINMYVDGMYEEFKKCFDQKNFIKAEKIIKTVTENWPKANILNAAAGSMCLVYGEGVKAYSLLKEYAKNEKKVDLWVLKQMAIWNMIAGKYQLALNQFSTVVSSEFDKNSLIPAFIFAVKTMKKKGFLDLAFEYYNRLLRVPNGFKLILVIKIEIIHILILKRRFKEANQEIEDYFHKSGNFFIRRLKVYALYLEKNYNEILRYKIENEKDPYVLYIIARIGLDPVDNYNIDVAYYLDEAIKMAKRNEFIFNTYGTFYYTEHRFSDAAEQYSNALAVNPDFSPALTNLSQFVKSNSKSDQPVYSIKNGKFDVNSLTDGVPDVDQMGFLDIWKIFGYSTFQIEYNFYARSPSLKYYLQSFKTLHKC